MKIYLIKVLHFFGRKIRRWRYRYFLFEVSIVHFKRIVFKGNVFFSDIPNFYFDDSDSRLLVESGVSGRGPISFVFEKGGVIKIGCDTFFNRNCSINCLDKIEIGDNCLFGEGVRVYDHNHKYRDLGKLVKDQGYSTSPVKIGNNCWIGSGVVILKGVTIGDNAVVGANVVVYRNIEKDSVVVAKDFTTLTINRSDLNYENSDSFNH